MDAGELTTADLVVEILSPSSAMYDRTAKADTYAALGVRELWLVDLDRRAIEQRVLTPNGWQIIAIFAGADVVASHTFPGLEVIPSQILPA
jgi:Uma2 family endonuclease